MKEYILLFTTLVFLSTSAIAIAEKKSMGPEVKTVSGTIIDNRCADANKDKLGSFIKTHTKECALMPPCAASGYSLYDNGSLLRFDGPSSKKIEKFLSEKNSRLNVTLSVRKEGNRYSLVSIKNS